jgi:hypothetical protein
MSRPAEEIRLEEAARRTVHWRRWGPYLSERQWGTVREDYSANGVAWDYFPHDHARSRAYRWGEDGLGGICDNHQRLCFAIALWNGRDPILKERLFGLTGPEGNHGEDVKEYYFYLDSTPTHSYMKYLYKYPQAQYPYAWIVDENHSRGRKQSEFELLDTGVFDGDRYFDVFVEYAKATHDDVLIRIVVVNRGPEPATLHLLPTLWFRNTWSWSHVARRPRLRDKTAGGEFATVEAEHEELGKRWLHVRGRPQLLFTENETNLKRFPTRSVERLYVKDAFHEYLVRGRPEAVNPQAVGTKVAAYRRLELAPGAEATMELRLTDGADMNEPFGAAFDAVFTQRLAEANEFYAALLPSTLDADHQNVCRQAFAGLLWGKQFYNYDVERWLKGDPSEPAPPAERLHGRNSDWTHLYNEDVLSMPDKWEYPWYAAWDLAFHCVPLALVDADFAKRQLKLLLREWYMHPNGQIPAYEWAFGDVNPPVHAWASWRVYKIEERWTGRADPVFLEKIFHKLLLNFTWWVNRKDVTGNNIFQGGFLGLDNIGVFDRSAELPTGGFIEQSDGTSWMGMYCLNLLEIAMELGRLNPSYEDVASKFFEHFMYIAYAMNNLGLWDEEDGFFYDVLRLPNGNVQPLKVRSMVGLIPLFAVGTVGEEDLAKLPRFRSRLLWFVRNRPDICETVAKMNQIGPSKRRILSILNAERLQRVLKVMLDETEFLSPYGIRALSHYHLNNPYALSVDGTEHRVQYEPAESSTGIFGGNSNWRGPIWFPLNFLIIESLQKYHFYYGDEFRVEFPTGSGTMMTLWEVARELSKRLASIFLRDTDGRRPVFGGAEKFQNDPHWRDLMLFYEYFHGDNGAGIGANHQTGWTALVAKLILQSGAGI